MFVGINVCFVPLTDIVSRPTICTAIDLFLVTPLDEISRKSPAVGPGFYHWGRVSARRGPGSYYLISHVVLCGISIAV